MPTLMDRLATLTPEKRRLLARRLDPLSFTQERLWFLHQLAPDVPVYNIPLPLRLTGSLAPHVLARSLSIIEARHEALRTAFPGIDGQVVQHVRPPEGATVPAVDLEAIPDERRDAACRRVLDAEVQRPIDVERGPLWRSVLVRLARDRHVLMLTWHHLVYDSWSRGVFMRELGCAYENLLKGRTPPLRPLTVQYRQFARWQRERLAGRILDAQLAYWSSRLGGDLPAAELPSDRPRPPQPSYRGADELFTLPPDATSGLHALADRAGVTLFMALVAGWALLLQKYTGEDDVVIGTATSGRARRELEDLIGCFVNTLALRVSLRGDPSVRQLLERARETALGAYAHQDVPFERLVHELQPERRLDRMPIFQTAVMLQNTPAAGTGGGAAASLTVQEVAAADRTASVDLALSVMETADGLVGPLRYATDLFDRATVTRLLHHFALLVRRMAGAPDDRISTLSLLTAADRSQILTAWNATARDVPRATMAALVEAQVARTPDAVALVCGHRHLTFAGLDRRATQRALWLIERHVGPESIVGILMERSLESVVCPLAVWKAGAAYLPLDAGHPRERLAFMLHECEPRLVLTQASLRTALPPGPWQTACVDEDESLDRAASAANPRPPADDRNAAYVIYTSGSTGEPKGVVVSHSGIASLAATVAERLGPTPQSRVLQFASLTFDASVWEMAMALTTGAALVIVPEEARAGEPLRDALIAFGITHATVPPVVLAGLSAGPELPVTSLIVAGEACGPDLAARWSVNRRLVNAYGPTETTVCATMSGALAGGEAPIGSPVWNTQVYVLDPARHPVPVGLAGELHVAGAGLARGYLRRPALTALKFIPNPCGAAGSRMYRTGDRVRWRADGQLEFVGRVDRQVKLRGHRVELGEVEYALRRQPEIRDAAAMVREGEAGARRLVAYVVPGAPGRAGDGDDLRRRLRRHLPEVMVPAVVMALPALPRTQSGKVDYRKLPPPAGVAPASAERWAPPRTEMEAVLARIWAEVLRLERVGIHENFFALGGDSILSFQIVARAAQSGLKIAARDIFEHQTVAALARAARPVSGAIGDEDPIVGPVPLLPMQAWFFESERPAPHHYNQQVLVALDPSMRLRVLEGAWAAVLAHHDALRSSFLQTTAGWQQTVLPTGGPARIPAIDLCAVEPEAHMRVRGRVCGMVQASLDLARGPIARPVVLAGPTDRHLFVVAHHLAIDGVSWRVVLDDLQRACRQAQTGEPLPRLHGTASVRQWAEALAAWAQTDAARGEADLWARMSGPAAALPRDVPEGGNTEGTAGVHLARFGRDETLALTRELPGRRVAYVQELLLAALVHALADWAGEAAWRIDLEGHGRDGLPADLDVSRTVGWLTSLYPVRVIAGSRPIDTLREVKSTLRRIPNQGLGYGVLRYLGAPEGGRPHRGARSVDIVFNYLGQVDQVLEPGGGMRPAQGPVGRGRDPRQARDYLLEVNSIVRGGRLHLAWTYSRECHRQATIVALADRFGAALRALIAGAREERAAQPWLVPADFPLADVTGDELAQLVARGAVADIYPLSPMQQGLLFHTVYAAERSSMYAIQMQTRIDSDLDAGAFRQAWQHVVACHDVLRTAFAWKRAGQPLQVVFESAVLECPVEDWRRFSRVEQAAMRVSYGAAEERRGFDLERPPLVRVALLRTGETEWHVVWTAHHLIVDGWSGSLVIGDVLRAYQAIAGGRPLPAPAAGRYREYIAWLQRQDAGKAEAFWRRTLNGLESPSRVTADDRTAIYRTPATEMLRGVLPASLAEDVQRIGRARSLTLNTWLTGAWALLLAHYARSHDVVFGSVVSGRPPHVPGIERTAGLFINTLPVRASIAAAGELVPWLARLQQQQTEAQDYEYTPLVQIQRWSAVPPDRPLFDTLFVYENYPIEPPSSSAAGGVRLATSSTAMPTTYPIVLQLEPSGAGIGIELSFNAGAVARELASEMLEVFQLLVRRTAAAPHSTLGSLLGFLSSAATDARARVRGAARSRHRNRLRDLPAV